jgi:hypothetical protein
MFNGFLVRCAKAVTKCKFHILVDTLAASNPPVGDFAFELEVCHSSANCIRQDGEAA